MSVIHFLVVFLTHKTIAQFSDHVDLQKVGEVIFKNEKYNVLKPTIHKITDHFVDFMQRRENVDKNEKILIDDNGFRHHWSGLGKKVESLRKTDISIYETNNQIKNTVPDDQIAEVSNYNTSDKNIPDGNLSENNTRNEGDPTENVVNEEMDTKTIQDVRDNLESTKKPMIRPKRAKTSKELDELEKALRADEVKKNDAKPAQPAATGKKKVRVSFFCPFFGVITMTSYMD